MTFPSQAAAHVLRRQRLSAPCLYRVVRRRMAHVLALGALFMTSLSAATAATFSYTGGGAGTATAPATGNFSTGFNPMAANSTYADTLSFGGTSYTATDDLTQQILANMLTFNNTGAVTLARGTGSSPSNSISLGGTAPTVNFNGAGLTTINLDIALAGNTTFVGMANSGSAVVGGTISGGFSLTANAANLLFNAANTYSGGTTIGSSATIQLGGAAGSLGAGNVVNNGILTDSDTSTNTIGSIISGTGSFSENGTATTTLTAANTYSGGTTIGVSSTLKLVFSGSAAPTLGTGTVVNNGLLYLSTGQYSVSNSISGSGSISLLGTGNTITLGGSNSFTGTVTTNANTLKLGSATALGNSSGVTVSTSGTLDLNGQTVGSNVPVTSIAGTLTNSSTTASTFGGSIGGATGFTVAGSTSINLSGAVALTNNSVVTTTGTGTLILNGTADNGATGLTASGGTVILSKTSDATHHALGINGFTLGNAGAVVQLAGTGNDQIADNGNVVINYGTFDLNGHSETIGGLSSSTQNGFITNTAGGMASTLTVGGQNTGGTFSGTIRDGAGTVSVIKTGTGTITFAGANTYSGGTTASGGTLNANATNSLGTGALTVSNANTGAGTNVVVNFNASQAVSSLSSTVATPASGTNTAQVNLASGTTLADTQSGTTTYAGSVSGAGSLSITGQSSAAPATVNYTGTDNAAQTNVGANATLNLNNSSNPALSGPVAVATGGTLGISANAANNEIATTTPPSTAPTTAAVTLNGGTLNASGSDGTVNDPTHLATTTVKSSMGALALGANGTQINPSVFILGAGTASNPLILAFADSKNTLGSGYLDITGYSGSTNALYIGTSADLSTVQLGQISFNGLLAGQLSNGEIYALAAAPEPGEMLSFLVGMVGVSGLVWRRRRKGAQVQAAGKLFSFTLRAKKQVLAQIPVFRLAAPCLCA